MSGLRSIPRTHRGEHLAYISPQEAQMLRQQGGGVASDGGQLRGPGGIPSFRGAPQLNPEQKAWASIGQAAVDRGEMSTLDYSRMMRGPGGQIRSAVGMQLNMGGGRRAAEPEPEPEVRDTSELEAEIKALTEGAQQRGADRMAAMYANLGWGTPPPQFGSATEGGDQFFTKQVTADQIPAYARLLNDPTIIQALGGGSSAPVPTARPDLRAVVQERAEEIRGNAKGGMINRYDLGGLVNNMLLQAGRTRDNIPTNAVS
jgi:hypothetical protein